MSYAGLGAAQDDAVAKNNQLRAEYDVALAAWNKKKAQIERDCAYAKSYRDSQIAMSDGIYLNAKSDYAAAKATYDAAVALQKSDLERAKQLAAQYGFSIPSNGCLSQGQIDAYATECARASAVLRGLGATGPVPACGLKQLRTCRAIPAVPRPPVQPAPPPAVVCDTVPAKPVLRLVTVPKPLQPAPPSEKSGAFSVGGLLAVILVGGTGYAIYRHQKKKKAKAAA